MPGLFQTFLNRVGQSYREADKRLGGWLPGGGTASPITRYKQEEEKNLAGRYNQMLDRQSSLNDHIGKPGRYANQGQVINAVRAVTQANANPLGVITGNPKEIEKVSQYYAQNPDIQNEYDLNTNLFLRYLSGTGAEGLKIPQETGQQIYSDIKQNQQKLSQPGFIGSIVNDPTVVPFKQQRIQQGSVPVYYGLGAELEVPIPQNAPDRTPTENKPLFQLRLPGDSGQQWQLRNSLGSYWAEPSGPGNSYTIKNEKYDFGYAPKSKGGFVPDNANVLSRPSFAPISPDMAGRAIVAQGFGRPYEYSLQIFPEGIVRVNP